ncbi:heparanase-like [Vespa velutina]|uniref:heparanase-like n=1 Tax=Vespa velutina TaxID=202808 RepID=UPI001FB26F22|nr:heparanase-like [Vespa velutina]
MTMAMNYFASNDWNKNQYQNLNDIRTHQSTTTITTRTVLNVIVLGFCSALIVFSFWNFNQYDKGKVSIFYLHTNEILTRTSKKFLSFGLDTSLLRNMEKLPIADERFINLARHLNPAFIRIGGTSADCLFFNQTHTTSARIISPFDDQDISNFTITNMDFESLYKFTIQSRLRMLFDLNVLIRYPNGTWDDTNAQDIILFAKGSKMNLDWQLGNEPNSFHHVFNRTITAEQLAKDYYQLRNLLNKVGYQKSFLVGPEVNHIGDSNKGQSYAEIFLEKDKDSINYVTWHQYYLNGHEAQVNDFINPSTFYFLPMQIDSMLKTIKKSRKSISMWLSETSSAYGGGAPGLSDRYIAGFLWLDKLGYSAKAGINVVIRQSLFGGYYAMIGPDLLPNPDWWISVIYKQFVSEKVLNILSPKSSEYIRIYAHCTPKASLINRVPAITIYGMNLDKSSAKIIIQGIFHRLNKNIKIFLYSLTSDHLTSRNIRMNGEILKLQNDGKLPPFHPIIMNPTQIIILPPFSMVFMVIHGVHVPACIS